MLVTLEDQTYAAIDALEVEDSKKTRSHATKLLVKISEAINSGHESLKQSLALNKPSPSAYLSVYHGIMQGNRLFELEQRLKEALGVKEKTRESFDEVRRKTCKLPIRMSGDRYKPPKKKLSPRQMELF